MSRMTRNNFIRYSLPWIIVAAVAIGLSVLPQILNIGYERIVFTSPSPTMPSPYSTPVQNVAVELVLNTDSKKIHIQGCGHIKSISDANKELIRAEQSDIAAVIAQLEQDGYTVCGTCKKKLNN